MKIALHGSYFGRNFGDTLILKLVYDWIKELDPEGTITLPYITSELEFNEITSQNQKFDLNRIDPKDFDGLIFGPGGYFGEPPSNFINILKWSIRNYNRHLAWTEKLFRNNIPYIIVGVGVGPLSNYFLRKKVIRLFQNAYCISVRDEISKKYLIDWGVSSSKISINFDVALSLKRTYSRQSNKNKKLGIHLSGSFLNQYKKLDAIVNFIERIKNKYLISFIEDNYNQFKEGIGNPLLEAFKKQGIAYNIIKYQSPNQTIDDISDMDLIITSKLHMGIVGYALGVPVISLPKHSKTFRFYEQINRQACCIKINDLQEKHLDQAYSFCNNSVVVNEFHKSSINNKAIIAEFIDSLKP